MRILGFLRVALSRHPDGPDVRRCPSCGEFFPAAAGVDTGYLDAACSAACATKHAQSMAM